MEVGGRFGGANRLFLFTLSVTAKPCHPAQGAITACAPLLAKNMPPACFLNASRPEGEVKRNELQSSPFGTTPAGVCRAPLATGKSRRGEELSAERTERVKTNSPAQVASSIPQSKPTVLPAPFYKGALWLREMPASL